MPIWRTTITKVSAERGEISKPQMQVEVSPTIGKAKMEKAGDSELLRVPYDLNINYGKAGKIVIGGDMYFVGESSDVLKDGVIQDSELVRQVYQRLFIEPMVLAISLAKDLILPIPVQMPQVKVEQSGRKADEKKK
ncbi:MAG: hypothetical protein GOV00_03025 [Candidatus Altiarchaeota archaeon]|nr:hypothetical protein [Candidatus Altiarchaeota archaeon]